MSSLKLSSVEGRVLGCLLEKERLTPENYPLSLNSLVTASNQSTNRDPIVGYDERTVDDAIHSLREKKLAILVHLAGARVQKYRHNLPEHYELTDGETALLCVLLLRGSQTPGELRARTERIFTFKSIEEVERHLEGLTKGTDPLVKVLAARPGQKERRYLQLLSEIEPGSSGLGSASFDERPVAIGLPRESASEKMEALQAEVRDLKTELGQLREEFGAFKKQFE